MRRWGLFGLLVIALVAAWWAFSKEEPAELGPAPARDPARERDAPPSSLRGRPDPSDATRQEDPAPPPPADAESTDVVTRIVRCQLQGVDADTAKATQLLVLVDETRHVASFDASGSVELRLEEALSAVPYRVLIRVDHPAYLPVEKVQEIESPRARFPGAQIVHDLVVRLFAATIVEGRVLDGTDGEPCSRAGVALFRGRKREDDPSAWSERALALAHTDAAGRYRLRIATGGTFLLAAKRHDRTPDARHVAVEIRQRVEAADLVIRPGSTVEGRVQMDGAPLPGVELLAGRIGEVRRFDLDGGYLAWADGRASADQVWAMTDEGGDFEFAALSPGSYRLFVNLGEGLSAHPTAHAAMLTRVVEAGATGVDFDIPPANLHLYVDGDGDPVAGVHLRVHGAGETGYTTTDEQGVAKILVLADHAYRITAEPDGYEPLEHEVRLEAGAAPWRVALSFRARSRPEIHVRVRDEAGALIPQADAVLTPLHRPPEARRPLHIEPTSAGGIHRVPLEEPGHYRLLVHPLPENPTFHRLGGHYLPVSTEVRVGERGVVEVDLETREGGRLRITARDADGTLLPARVTILDEAGEPVTARFVGAGLHRSRYEDDVLPVNAPSLVVPVLEPGRYTVRLEHEGHASREEQVRLTAGETTDVDWVLTDTE